MLRSKGSWDDVTVCSVSGIIGVGKSTALRRLNESGYLQQPDVHVCIMLEPTDLWQQHGWLESFYQDPVKRALSFQLIVFHTHVQCLQQTIDQARSDAPGKHILCLIERCMYDQLLFWKAQCADSMEDDAYMLIWRQWRHFIPPTKMIFHWTTNNLRVVMQRITDRARLEEKDGGVSTEYQQLLMAKHNHWYSGAESRIPEQEEAIPCVQIDASIPYHNDELALAQLANLITTKIKGV